jgi:predicted  nucleic acid-binding Zn-ribbon protein
MNIAATALDEKVRRLETDVRDLEQRVEDAHQRAEDAKRAAVAAQQEQEKIVAELRRTTVKAEAVDKALKGRMHEEEIRAREVGAVWRMVQIVASLGLFTWSLWTGKLTATLEYLRQFAAGQGK